MDFPIKSLSAQALPAALERAERYRLLNDPVQAESICRDILNVESDHSRATIILILSLTDQFANRIHARAQAAWQYSDTLADEYQRCYYKGIICERRARAHFAQNPATSASMTYDWLAQALDWYGKAEVHKPADNDEVILRWNACVRFLKDHPNVGPEPEGESPAPALLE